MSIKNTKGTPTPTPTTIPTVNECFTATYFNISNSQNCSGTPINTIEGICGETCIISEPEDGDFVGSSIITDCNNTYIFYEGIICNSDNVNVPINDLPFPICFEEFGLKIGPCETTDDPTILIITIVSISVVLIITIIVAVFYTKKNNNGDTGGYKLQQQH